MADQLDRDFEQFSFNSHPWQLDNYEIANKLLDKKLEDAEVRASGQTTQEEQVAHEFETLLNEETAKLPSGEKLSLEKMTELLVGVMARKRKEVFRPQHGKDENGQMRDFDEVRRPFMNPTEASHTT